MRRDVAAVFGLAALMVVATGCGEAGRRSAGADRREADGMQAGAGDRAADAEQGRAGPTVAEEMAGLPVLPAGQGWRLVWHDEFDGTVLDAAKWAVPPDAPRRDGHWVRRAVGLDGRGCLAVRTFEEDGQFYSGCVQTKGTFERAFAYYVARMRLQRQRGHWSAFWLMGPGVHRVGDEGRDGTEIDIMEKPWLGERVQHTLHWDGYGEAHRTAGEVARVPGVMVGFHTFALWWTPEEYVFYVDGRETWRTRAGGVCQVPLYMMLSSEIGDWAGDIREAALPDEFLVDYVRVYEPTGP